MTLWKKKNIIFILLLIVIAGGLMGCATSYDKRGRYHKVRGGESLWRIAKAYRVDVQELAETNNILEPGSIRAGMKLYIPGRSKKAGYKKLPFGGRSGARRSKRGSVAKRGSRSHKKSVEIYRGRFNWPLKGGRVTSLYGMRNGRRHDGIDISAKQGTPLYASAAGKVAFSGKMRGYGNIILIRHKDDFFTAYAHNRRNGVRKGQSIKQGQQIGTVGRTGRTTGAHVHFEIRQGQRARNPLFFLPERKGASKFASRKKK